jgi:hypothetical protein
MLVSFLDDVKIWNVTISWKWLLSLSSGVAQVLFALYFPITPTFFPFQKDKHATKENISFLCCFIDFFSNL